MTTLSKMLQGLGNALGASLSTLTTTAKTIVGAINELATQVSSHSSTIGSGSLDTTSQTLIGAINEVFSKYALVGSGTVSVSTDQTDKTIFTPTKTGTMIFFVYDRDNEAPISVVYRSGISDRVKLYGANGGGIFVGTVTSGTPVVFKMYLSTSTCTAQYYYFIF